ncbi:hypothetical protein M3Y98_00090200 [Aphelenchoides besseyi]|nr:hypothetical protein M3Y98_00090200 [Aphelenchoides besseyi]KAI6198502.1 hypothetical protein M3Y96_00525800 [Aphelenchoides besseyi]
MSIPVFCVVFIFGFLTLSSAGAAVDPQVVTNTTITNNTVVKTAPVLPAVQPAVLLNPNGTLVATQYQPQSYVKTPNGAIGLKSEHGIGFFLMFFTTAVLF